MGGVRWVGCGGLGGAGLGWVGLVGMVGVERGGGWGAHDGFSTPWSRYLRAARQTQTSFR